MKKPLIVLTGPTAVGKTKLSILLAKAVGGEIISADSMQIYRYMNIGSAKIKPAEMSGVPHYLIDELDPKESFHVVRFQEMAKKAMEQIYQNGHIPILVGGTGFYLQAILNDIDFDETSSGEDGYRSHLEQMAAEKGSSYLHSELQQVDEQAAGEIHPNNVKRIIRALEFYHQTGKKISEHNQEQKARQSPYNFIYFVLNDDRKKLYAQIDQRVDQMITEGLLQEVAELRERGYTRGMVSMQGLGYKEILDYLEGKYTWEEAVYILKRDTRHFAKRQITWFKRESCVDWIDKSEFAHDERRMLEYMVTQCKERNIYDDNKGTV